MPDDGPRPEAFAQGARCGRLALLLIRHEFRPNPGVVTLHPGDLLASESDDFLRGHARGSKDAVSRLRVWVINEMGEQGLLAFSGALSG
jgi:hypothetical protein